jgi:carnitine O-palmitoyltransferase 1, liver isoform
LAVVAIVTGLRRYKNIDFPIENGIITIISNKIPKNWFSTSTSDVIACFLVSGTAWLGTIAIRKYTLQALFSYHGWMYELRSKEKKIFDYNKLWYFLVHAIVGRDPRLYSYQGSMPSLPLPALKDTVQRVSLLFKILSLI